MKTSFYRTMICASLIILTLASCSRGGAVIDDGSGGGGPHVFNPTDTNGPVITITTPSNNQVFISGNTINVTGRITDDYGLYRGTIRIINDATGGEIKGQVYEIHGLRTFDYNISHTTSVTVPSDYTVVVSFEDHGLNVTTSYVKVKVDP
jgi:hypothetical protein